MTDRRPITPLTNRCHNGSFNVPRDDLQRTLGIYRKYGYQIEEIEPDNYVATKPGAHIQLLVYDRPPREEAP